MLVVRDDNNQPGYANNNYNSNGLVCKCLHACWYVDRAKRKELHTGRSIVQQLVVNDEYFRLLSGMAN